MQLVHALAAGIVGAENGTAEVYNRLGSQRIACYLGDGGFEGLNQQAAGTDIDLDEYGSAVIYVTQLAKVIVKDAGGTTVRTFTCGNYDAAVEVISPSFLGTSYDTGASGANKPTTLEHVLDLVLDSFGTTDFNVLLNGSSTTVENALSTISGYFENVKAEAYGAVGDGTTDDSAAIAAAFTAAATSGRIVFFPPGTYRVTGTRSWANGINMLGCGPDKSIITIDHASSALFSSAAVTSTQAATGLAFGAAQSHSGSLFSITGSGRYLFTNCKIGNANTVSASAEAYLKINDDSISPQFELVGCEVYMPTSFAGQVVSDGTFTATSRCVLTGTKVDLAGTIGTSLTMFAANSLQVTGCYFDIASAAASAFTIRMLTATTGGKVVAVGNDVTAASDDAVFIYGNGGITIVEHGNHMPSSVLIVSTFTGGGVSSLGSRLGRIYEANQSTATLDLDNIILNYEFIHITITNNTAFSIGTGGATGMKGLAFTLLLENQAGGATGTITYGAASFAGATSVTGTAPPTSIAAVGTIVSERWVATDGPDGERFYPVGGAYAGT